MIPPETPDFMGMSFNHGCPNAENRREKQIVGVGRKPQRFIDNRVFKEP